MKKNQFNLDLAKTDLVGIFFLDRPDTQPAVAGWLPDPTQNTKHLPHTQFSHKHHPGHTNANTTTNYIMAKSRSDLSYFKAYNNLYRDPTKM